MGAKNTGTSNTTYLNLKAKTSETDPTPFFGKNEKVNGEWSITDKFNAVDGIVVGIEHKTYDYQSEVKNKCLIKFKDDDGSFTVIESNFNNLLYSMLNSFMNLDTFKDILELQVWLGKANAGENQYPNITVKKANDRVGWKLKYDELPKPAKVKHGSKTFTDDSNVIHFWVDKIYEIQKMINSSVIDDDPLKIEEGHSDLNNTDNLPF
jgi:hypothetical protein